MFLKSVVRVYCFVEEGGHDDEGFTAALYYISPAGNIYWLNSIILDAVLCWGDIV